MTTATAVKQEYDSQLENQEESLRGSRFYQDVLEGLSTESKSLSPKYFYDEQGSKYFDQICDLDEYYPYKSELALLPEVAKELNDLVTENTSVIEFGAGSLQKIQPLLEAVERIDSFIPIDISGEHLQQSCAALRDLYPNIRVTGIEADFTDEVQVPNVQSKKLGFFPGSTIGNFTPDDALKFLRSALKTLGKESRLLIGVDTKKSPEKLHKAYNDAKGVTAKFNMNILNRINRELGAGIDLDKFEHYAYYNTKEGRVEMHLVSLEYQHYKLNGSQIDFVPGESIHTENSYKYSPAEFQSLAVQAGWRTQRVWMAKDNMFSMYLLDGSNS